MGAPDGPYVDAIVDLFIWLVVGLLLIYFIAGWADRLGKSFASALPMIIICVIVGMAAVAMFNRFF